MVRFENPLIDDIYNGFIADHVKRFVDAVSEDELRDRLENNLDGINLVEGELSFKYSGFNEKIITANCVNDMLSDTSYLKDFEKGLRCELVKAAYTVSDAASESLLFGTYEKLSDNSLLLAGGTDRFRDALVTFIEGSEKSVFDEFSEYVGEKTLVTAAFNSDENSFRMLFDAFDMDEPYASFAEHIEDTGSDFFKEFYIAYLPGVSDRNIIAQAPFWREKKYRDYLTDDMDEDIFIQRLMKAFDNEVQLHPGVREAILRGENTALIDLVKEEYLNDIYLEKEREIERDELPDAGEAEEEEFAEEEDITDIQEFSFSDDEEQRKKEEREKRAAFSKRRNEQYASSNAEIDERHWKENEYLERKRLIEERREKRKALQEENDREYYRMLHESENYESKNINGHIGFNRKDKESEYNDEDISPIHEEKREDPDETIDYIGREHPFYTNHEDMYTNRHVDSFRQSPAAESRRTDSFRNRMNTTSHHPYMYTSSHVDGKAYNVLNSASISSRFDRLRERAKTYDIQVTDEKSEGLRYVPRGKYPFEDLEHSSSGMDKYRFKDAFKSPEKSRLRTKEYFEKAAERHNAAVRNIRYYSRATGYSSFVAGTGRAFKYYMIGALSDGDTANVMTTYNKLRRYDRLATTFVVTPFMKKITKVSSMELFMKTDFKQRMNRGWEIDSKTRLETEQLLRKLLRSKKSRTEFLEELNIFDYSSKSIQSEFHDLRLLEKRGLLTKEQADRLKTLRKGIPLSGIEMKIRTLSKKKKKGTITKTEEKLLDDLLKVRCITAARRANQKSWVRSAFYLMSDHLRKAEDVGTQGLLKLADFSTSIYTRRTVRASVRFSKFLAETGGKVLKKGGAIYLSNAKSGRAIAKGTELLKDKLEEGAGKKIASIAESRAGRFSQKGFNLVSRGYRRIRSPFGGRVSRVFRKTFDIATKPIQYLAKAGRKASSYLGKMFIVLGGILIGMILFVVLTEAISSVFSFILEDERSGKITLKPYVEVLEAKNEEFTEKVSRYANIPASNGTRFEHVYYELSTEDNTREILSMMAVRFNQEMNKKHTTKEADEEKCDHYQEIDGKKYCLGHRDEALNYVRTLYDASHVINVTESAPYNCGKTSGCTHRVAETKTITVDGEEKEITTYHCPGDHINATISSSVLHFDEIFMVDGNNGIYGNAGAPPLAKGESIAIPTGLGSVHTYMGWHTITNKSSNQYRLKVDAGENYDGEGFARIGDRYVIACTTTYGQVGDYVDFYQQDGSVLKCIIGDIKNSNDAGCNKWGHQNGECIIEFVVNGSTWYFNGAGSHPNPGTSLCHPEWNQNLTKAVNRGNYWRNDYTEEEKETDKDTSKPEISAAQKLVADNARNGISTYPPTLNYCAAWVSGVYEASGQGYPGGNAIDFWNRWKSSGSTSMNNIPVGAVVVGSGSGSMGAIYGHVGIYIGNGMVAENIGRLNIVSLDAWAAAQKQTCQGHTGFIGWVWPNNKPLGQGVDGSTGTGGYTDFSFWDDFHRDWAKNIYNQDWDEIYVEWGADIDLDWTDSTIEIDGDKLESFRKLMDDLEGSKYRQGAAEPYEFDSSGLIKYLYEESRVYEFGEERPTCESLAKTSIEMEEEDAKFGDLIIWTDDNGKATHVVVYCGYDKIYECTPDNGVRYTKIYDKENAKYYRLAVND